MSWKDILKYYEDDGYTYTDRMIDYYTSPNFDILDYDVYAVIYVPHDKNKRHYMYIMDWPNVLYDGEDLNIDWKTESPQTIDQKVKNKIDTDFRNKMNEISEEDYEIVEEYRDVDDGKLYYASRNEYVYKPEIIYAVHVEHDDFNVTDYEGMRIAGLMFDTIEEAIKKAKELENQVN